MGTQRTSKETTTAAKGAPLEMNGEALTIERKRKESTTSIGIGLDWLTQSFTL